MNECCGPIKHKQPKEHTNDCNWCVAVFGIKLKGDKKLWKKR